MSSALLDFDSKLLEDWRIVALEEPDDSLSESSFVEEVRIVEAIMMILACLSGAGSGGKI